MNRRDALGRFVTRGVRHSRAWIQGFRAAGATVAVGVGVKTKVGDVRILSHDHHHHRQDPQAVLIQEPRKMARKRSRSKRGRSRSKSRTKRKGFKRTGRRGGVSRKGHSKLVIGRQWPPSEMQAKFTTNRDFIAIDDMSSTLSTRPVGIYLSGIVVAPGFSYLNGDATGTATVFPSLEPRNWTFMTTLYKRARMIGMSHRVEIIMSSNVAIGDQEYIMCTWYSSDLDTSNPLVRLAGAALGTAAPWSSSDGYRDILLQSRRVTRHRLLGPGLPKGRTNHVFHFKLGNQLKDRYGNIVVGGKHVRDVTNNPGGVVHTTDKDVASALTQPWGIDNALNIVIFNAQRLNVNIPVDYRITSTPTLLFYDRNLEVQVAP